MLRSIDGGVTWELHSIADAASLDLRDIEAISASTAYAMVAGADTARIYKTADGGRTWTRQYDDTRKGVFLDGIAFWDEARGIAFGDPMDGRFLVLRTEDGGAHWTPVPAADAPVALRGEAAFAASGTSITVGPNGRVWIGTGGALAGAKVARVFRSSDYGRTWAVSDTPIPSGSASTGIFSLAFRDSLQGVAVGGDYVNPRESRPNVAVTSDGGRTWQIADTARVTSYLSAVAFVPASAGKGQARRQAVIAVGTAGMFRSLDEGRTWGRTTASPYNAVAAVVGSGALVAVGAGGRTTVWCTLDEATQDMSDRHE